MLIKNRKKISVEMTGKSTVHFRKPSWLYSFASQGCLAISPNRVNINI